MKRAERVLIISMQKSGTHLIQELMTALDYRIYGAARIAPEVSPVFDDEQRSAIARLVMNKDEYEALNEHGNADRFLELTDAAWESLAWTWQKRLGVPLVNRYGQEQMDFIERAPHHHQISSTRFVETPPNICWIFHELDSNKVDGKFLEEWSETGEPRIIFNYRDPRDVMLSFVNYLSGKTGRGFGNFSEFKVFSRILQSKDSLKEKLSYALRDRSFPGHGDLERAMWMLHHPKVCKVSFEELVGPSGGGTYQAQYTVIERILKHLGIAGNPEEFGNRIFNQNAFTFMKGQIGGWQDVYTSEHMYLFEKAFGDILEQYGYATVGAEKNRAKRHDVSVL